MTTEELLKLKCNIDFLASIEEETLRKLVLEKILESKLERSYDNYIERLTSKINYILSRNNYRVIKAINKMKQEEAEDSEEQLGGDEIYE